MEGGWERKRQQEQQRQQKRVSRRSSADVGRFVCGLCFGPSVFCRWRSLPPFVHIEWRRGKVREKKKPGQTALKFPSLPFRSCVGIDTRIGPGPAPQSPTAASIDRPTDTHPAAGRQSIKGPRPHEKCRGPRPPPPCGARVYVCTRRKLRGGPLFKQQRIAHRIYS